MPTNSSDIIKIRVNSIKFSGGSVGEDKEILTTPGKIVFKKNTPEIDFYGLNISAGLKRLIFKSTPFNISAYQTIIENQSAKIVFKNTDIKSLNSVWLWNYWLEFKNNNVSIKEFSGSINPSAKLLFKATTPQITADKRYLTIENGKIFFKKNNIFFYRAPAPIIKDIVFLKIENKPVSFKNCGTEIDGYLRIIQAENKNLNFKNTNEDIVAFSGRIVPFAKMLFKENNISANLFSAIITAQNNKILWKENNPEFNFHKRILNLLNSDLVFKANSEINIESFFRFPNNVNLLKNNGIYPFIYDAAMFEPELDYKEVFLFKITSPDLYIPIKSFQSRIRDGEPTFLEVVVPDGNKYIPEITARPDFEMVVYKGYKNSNDEIIATQEITTVDFEDTQYDRSDNKDTLRISGHRTSPNTTPKRVSIDKVISYALQKNGSRRLRTDVNFLLKPGDTLKYNDEFIQIKFITINVDTKTAYMDITEV